MFLSKPLQIRSWPSIHSWRHFGCAAGRRFLDASRVLLSLVGMSLITAGVIRAENDLGIHQEYRIVWGGPTEKIFLGNIVAEGGTLQLVRNLSVQPSAAGTIVQVDSKSIRFDGASPATFGGMDVSVRGTLATRLRMTFQVQPGESKTEYVVSLQELQNQLWIQTLEGHDCRIAIERQIFDKLQVKDDRPNKIFHCGEEWPVSVSGHRTGLSSGDYLLTATWTRRKGNAPVASQPVKLDANGSFQSVDFNIQVPNVEGAHQLEFSLVRPSLVQRWTQSKPLMSRSVELVALMHSNVPRTIAAWKPLLAIDTVAAVKAGNLSWLVSFANSPLSSRGLEIADLPGLAELSSPEQWNRLLSLSKSVAANGPVQRSGEVVIRDFPLDDSSDRTSPQSCVAISPNAWLSLPLSGLQAGHPHKLRIQIPADHANTLTVLIKDHSGLEASGIYPQHTVWSQPSSKTDDQDAISQEVLFWPRSDSIQIVLTSGHRTKPATVGKILVESAEWGPSIQTPEAQSASASAPGRRVGLYLDQPFLADYLAAPKENDPKTGRVLESWATWQAVAERMATHLRLSGANTLILLGASDGGTLFPIQSMPTVPWLDKSTFFSDGRSPHSHDVIALLLAHLDRMGMGLVLEIDPSPNMVCPEPPRHPDPQGKNQGIYQVPWRGWPDAQNASENRAAGESPYARHVNPLHESVQSTSLKMVQEIVQRYKDSPAFQGISLRLRPGSPLVFAGEHSGYNADLIREFARDKGLQLPDENQSLQEWMSGSARLTYLTWRAERLSDFYQKLARVLQQQDRKLNLYLNTLRLWENPDSQGAISDQEVALRNPHQYMLGHGLDLERLSATPGLMIVQGSLRSGASSLASSDWIRRAVADGGVSLPGSALQAAFISHQPRSKSLIAEASASPSVLNDQPSASPDDKGLVLPLLEAARPEPPVQRLYVDAVAHGDAARQALIDQLLRGDQQMIGFGGWYPVWTLEPRIADLISTFKSLPPVPLTDLPQQNPDSPIRIRQGSYGGKEYVALVNASQWAGTLTLRTQHGDTPTWTVLGSGRSEQLSATPGQLTVQLSGGDLLAWTWDVGKPEIVNVDFKPSEPSLVSISQQLSELEAVLTKTSERSSQRILLHGSGTFEHWTDQQKPVGWNVSALPETVIQQATELPHSGQFSIVVENRNRGDVAAWIQSDSIEIPTTGRLALKAWLRSSAADPRKPLVRLGVLGRRRNGSRYQISTYYGGQEAGAKSIANDWGRRPAELYIADLPVDDLVELHVAIDLIGQGKIWVDDVEVAEPWLHPDERNYLRGQLLVAKQKLQENNPFTAERILRSPWNWYIRDLPSIETLYQTDSSTFPGGSSEAASGWNPSKSAFQQWRESLWERWRR